MNKILWYVSRPKVEHLGEGLSSSIIDKISIKLKANWIEAEVAKQLSPSFGKKLARVVDGLEHDGAIASFESAPGSRPALFSFAGQAGRLISDGIFWVAISKPPVALLLVGDSHQALGGAPRSDGAISPTADPVGAVSAAFRGDPDDTLSSRLGYAWTTVAERSGLGEGALPSVYGFAFFAGSFRADGASMGPAIQYLVVGTPIFVEQV
jgi:hypothetical protein